MNDAEAVARGTRAQMYRDEFLGPILDHQRDEYRAKIIAIASSELDPARRTQALTMLSMGLRVLDNVAAGMDAAVRDGEVAQGNLMKADRVADMKDGKRRLFSIAPQR